MAAPVAVLYREPDPAFHVSITRAKDWSQLVVTAATKTTTEVTLLPAASVAAVTAAGAARCVQARVAGLQYFVVPSSAAGALLVLTNYAGGHTGGVVGAESKCGEQEGRGGGGSL